MANNLLSSEVRKGERVTVFTRNGGVGVGFLVEGEVWVPTGSLWAVKAEDDVFGLEDFQRDGGRTYDNQAGFLYP